MTIRTSLKNISENVFKAIDSFDERTNGWLTPLLAIPFFLSFNAANVLETQTEKDKRLAEHSVDKRESELLYAIRKMIYNPIYLLGKKEARQNLLRDFRGEEDIYSVEEMDNFIGSDFSKVWGSALLFGNRKQNLEFIAQYAVRKVGDPNDKEALREVLKNLMYNPETFGYEIQAANQIKINDAVEHLERINKNRENKIRELAELAVFKHGLGVGENGYNKVRTEMIGNDVNDLLQRCDISPDDVLNYAIDNADNIVNTKYAGMENKTTQNLKIGMAKLKTQRDSSKVDAHFHHEI